jgi:hypothetical protein
MYVQHRDAHALAAYGSHTLPDVDSLVVVGHLGGILPIPILVTCSPGQPWIQTWSKSSDMNFFTPLVLVSEFSSQDALSH